MTSQARSGHIQRRFRRQSRTGPAKHREVHQPDRPATLGHTGPAQPSHTGRDDRLRTVTQSGPFPSSFIPITSTSLKPTNNSHMSVGSDSTGVFLFEMSFNSRLWRTPIISGGFPPPLSPITPHAFPKSRIGRREPARGDWLGGSGEVDQRRGGFFDLGFGDLGETGQAHHP